MSILKAWRNQYMPFGNKTQQLSVAGISDQAPVVVGGVGGSGTRVIARLLSDAGVDMGSDLNGSLDDLTFTALFKRKQLWPLAAHISELTVLLQTYLSARGHPTPPQTTPEQHARRARRVLESIGLEDSWVEAGTLEERRKTLVQVAQASGSWGWKEPNCHIFLPYLLQALPNMKYIHVLRNGLDMAFSTNQNQLSMWGPFVLGRPVDNDSPGDSFAYWCKVHSQLLQYHQTASDRILLLRLEMVLEQPGEAMAVISKFLNINISDYQAAAWRESLRSPRSLCGNINSGRLIPDDDQTDILLKLGYSNPGEGIAGSVEDRSRTPAPH